jgi:hypothetical protein
MGWRKVLGVVLAIPTISCAKEEEHPPLIVSDPSYLDHPLCEARASAYYPDGGCLGPTQFFGRAEVSAPKCPVADASVCVAFSADAGTPLEHRVWVFSGEHYGIPDHRLLVPCDPETRAVATRAPRCEAASP